MKAVITTWLDFIGPHPLEKLIPDVPGPRGRKIRGYEVLFYPVSDRLFIHTYRGKYEISFDPKSDLPYILGTIGNLIKDFLKEEKWQERRFAEDIARINESAAERLADLERQNEAFKLLFAQQSDVESGSKEELQSKLNAAKAAREADAAGYNAVIAELREEVARLKECAK